MTTEIGKYSSMRNFLLAGIAIFPLPALTGCATPEALHPSSESGCSALIARNVELINTREAERKALRQTLHLIYHPVSGALLNPTTISETEALARRENARWQDRDEELARALTTAQAQMRAANCPAPSRPSG